MSPLHFLFILFVEDEEKNHKYKEARFVDGKKPYISFRAYNRATGQEMYPVKDYKYKEYDQRTIDRINWINEQLKKGLTVYIIPKANRVKNDVKKKPPGFSVVNGLEFYFKYKRFDRKATEDTYLSQSRLFIDFLAKKNYMDLDLIDFQKKHILEYIDEMNMARLSQTTINSRLYFVSSVFTFLVQREKVNENPFLDVKRKKGKPKTKTLLLPEIQKEIITILETENTKLYIFIHFLFHNFIRPKELRLLKRQYINLSTNRLTIPESIAKRNWRKTIITPPLRKIILKYDLHKGDPESIILPNSQGSPHGKNYFGDLYLNFRKKHGFPDYSKLYHWKDMGVSAYYREYKDILFVKNQCGHASLDQTYTYLDKDLGVIESDLNFKNAPEI